MKTANINLMFQYTKINQISAADQLDTFKNENERQKITIANLERRLAQQVTFSLPVFYAWFSFQLYS